MHVDRSQDSQDVATDFCVLDQRNALAFLRLVVLVEPLIDQTFSLAQLNLVVVTFSFVVKNAEPKQVRVGNWERRFCDAL